MIRFERVSKRYPGGIDALRELSFALDAGAFGLILGHSGAGKSTLLKLIAAVERPSGGRVEVNGQDVGRLRRGAVAVLRRSLGLIFQERRILFDRSAFHNVMLPLAIAGFGHKEALGRARAALDKVGLLAREQAMPISLSGGEQQRLAIARAIVNRPSLLLADEPTAHLDADYAADIVALLRSFHQVGVTVLVATHDEAPFAACAPQRLVLCQGVLAA